MNASVIYDGQILCGADTTQQSSDALYRWANVDVKWSIVQAIPTIDPDSFAKAIETAFKWWADVCGLRPHQVGPSEQANIVIGVQSIGPGGVLADSELPVSPAFSMSRTLRQRYDVQEAWVIADNPPPNKIDFVRVACHEIGHAIGIPHISNPGSLMNPTYSASIRKPQVADIAEAVARYGMPQKTPTTSQSPNDCTIILPQDIAEICSATVRMRDGTYRILLNNKLL